MLTGEYSTKGRLLLNGSACLWLHFILNRDGVTGSGILVQTWNSNLELAHSKTSIALNFKVHFVLKKVPANFFKFFKNYDGNKFVMSILSSPWNTTFEGSLRVQETCLLELDGTGQEETWEKVYGRRTCSLGRNTKHRGKMWEALAKVTQQVCLLWTP